MFWNKLEIEHYVKAILHSETITRPESFICNSKILKVMKIKRFCKFGAKTHLEKYLTYTDVS